MGVTSLTEGVAMQRLVFFSKQPTLLDQAELARGNLRRTTVLVIVALLVNCVIALWALRAEIRVRLEQAQIVPIYPH